MLYINMVQALSAIARTGFTMAKLGSGGTTGGGGLYGDGPGHPVDRVDGLIGSGSGSDWI